MTAKDYECGQDNIEQHQNEELPIVETNTVVDPWAMVVHIEDATVADRTVVAPLRFEYVTNQTIPSLLVLRIVEVETLKP